MFVTESFIRLGQSGICRQRKEMCERAYVDLYINPVNDTSLSDCAVPYSDMHVCLLLYLRLNVPPTTPGASRVAHVHAR